MTLEIVWQGVVLVGDKPAAISVFWCEATNGNKLGISGIDFGFGPFEPGADSGWFRHFDDFPFLLGLDYV